MDSSDKTLFARIAIGLVAVAAVLAICWIFDFNMRKGKNVDPSAFSLAGEWKFHNGPLPSSSSLEVFSETVTVPEPLRGQIKAELQDEFWYQKSILLPTSLLDSTEPLSLFLGSIKGDHEIYWNGERVTAGEKTALSLAPISNTFLKKSPIDLRVKVIKPDHLFPGIVHMQPMGIGRTARFEEFREYYYFDSGVKPLILGAFKICLFFIFSFLFLLSSKKSEYFSFAFFVLFSGIASALYSRFLPTYPNFYLRNAFTFYSSLAAFCSVPWVTADVIRLKTNERFMFKAFGAAIALIAISAAPWISSRELQISLFQLVSKWLPVTVGLPSVAACIFAIYRMDAALKHRRNQIFVFTTFLTLGVFAWFASAGALLSFQYIPYPELWDAGLFLGLALSTAFDMKYSSRRSDRAGKVIPKWFSGFLSSGLDQVTLELPMVAIAVDTVGYTRILSELDTEGKSELHNKIRARMAPVIEQFGAHKLSDRGDGALFAWDLSGDQEYKKNQVRSAIAAAEYLVTESANSVGIKFRVGIAAGTVRGELKGSELSFLGEPLNAASRLEAAATPGTVLLHDSVVPFLSSSKLESDWINIEVKGVQYRAFTLGKAA